MGAPLGNKFAVGNNGGRPLKFKTVDEMQKQIDAYFDDCEKKGKPLTVSGLAVYLDTTRDLLIDYQSKDEYSDAIKKAKARIQAYAEECLWTNRNPAGVIFSLKNNYHWADKQQIDTNVTGDLTINITVDDDK